MHTQDINITLLIQSLEQSDEEGELISFEERRRADRFLEGEDVGSPSDGILARAQYLSSTVQRVSPLLWQLALKSQLLGSYTRWGVVVICLILGFGLQSFGSQGAFHVLSPALLGLIIWNFISISALLMIGRSTHKYSKRKKDFRNQKTSIIGLSAQLWRLNHWMQHRWLRHKLREHQNAQIQLKTAQMYTELMYELSAPLITKEMRRLLHLGAAMFALGALGGAYWEGVIRAYQVTAASTFLSTDGVYSIAKWILLPARLIWGELPPLIPSGKVVDISHQLTAQPTHGPAAPWVHYYAFSVMIWVILPRLILVLIETIKLWRARLSIPVRLGWLESIPTLNIALAAHTNVGKTSLARTLLRRDVGEVRDAEHVTQTRASYFLVNASHVRVRLWDTPGFGKAGPIRALAEQAHQLLKQLQIDSPPRKLTPKVEKEITLIELLSTLNSNAHSHQLSALDYEALRALEEESDLILYLVPAFPNAQQLEQTDAEWSMLALLNQPVLVVINRLFESDQENSDTENQEKLHQERAQRSLKVWRDVLSNMKRGPKQYEVYVLDAFQRTYQDERGFYEMITHLAPIECRPIAEHALSLWESEQLEIQTALAQSITHCFEALSDLSTRMMSRKQSDFRKAEDELQAQASELIHQTHERILDLIGLQGEIRSKSAQFALEVMVVTSTRPERRTWGAILGGAISGLATGVVADVMAGGLSLGGGMIVGGVLGALGGAGVVEGYDYFIQRDQEVLLSDEALINSLKNLLLFTLGASAHGRAQGEFSIAEWGDQAQELEYSAIASRCHEVINSLEMTHMRQLKAQLNIWRASDEITKLPSSTPQPSQNDHQTPPDLAQFISELVESSLQSL